MDSKLKDGSSIEDVQDVRQQCNASPSLYEVSVIDNMASFLEAHGGSKIDPKVLRHMAEALSKKMNDTSPGTLQDVTMDNSYGVGYRSPCVQQPQHHYQSPNSPTNGPGRSVREFEEQMASLRKENFNLKLRLYFIEESTPGYKNQNVQDGPETIMKQLIDSKVELEILRKDVQDKQSLLQEADQYMSQLEQLQKEADEKNKAVIEELNQKIQFLEIERDVDKSNTGDFMKELLESSDLAENDNAKEKIRELEGLMTEYESKVSHLQDQIHKLDEILIKRDETIAECQGKIKELMYKHDELTDMFEMKSQENVNIMRHMRSLRVRNDDLSEKNATLERELKEQVDKHVNDMAVLEKVQKQLRDHQETLNKMQGTISVKNTNSARLLERLQRYEELISKLNIDRNAAKRENRFFRSVIEKFRKSQCIAVGIDMDRALSIGDGSGSIDEDIERFEWRTLSFTNCKDYNQLGRVGSQRLAIDYGQRSSVHGSSSEISLLPKNSSRLLHFSVSAQDFRSDMSNENVSDDKKTKQLRDELQEHKSELADKACMLQEAEEKLKSREQIHEQACRTIQKLMLTIKNQQIQINTLQSQNASKDFKESSAAESPTRGLNCTGVCESLAESEAFKELCLSDRQQLEKVIAEQDATIQSLKSEVKKKTANLQNLVNKELWEKNREIERLTKLVNNTSASSSPHSPAGKLGKGDELQKSFTDVDYNKAVERNKLLQKKVDILIQRIGVEGSNEAVINKLRSELRESREAADQAEKWRRECADVCSTLTNRLEELAGFLNSLLKHKDVLGVLAADRRRAIRKAVDRSLDLSKSLNMTLSFTGVSFVDQSFAQLSNLSEILGDVDGNENKTFNSHEELLARQSVEHLKAENTALKKELDKRRSNDTKKERRSLPLHVADNQSESEAWSEPDRKVSLARIGLEDHSASLSKETMAQRLDTDSESDALNLSRTAKGRLQERIGQLEQLVGQRDDRILEIQCQLVDADNRLKKENLRVLDMTNELEQLRKRNEQLHADLLAMGSQEANDQSALLQQIEEKSTALEKLDEERQRLGVEVHLAHMEIQTLRDDKDEVVRKYEEALGVAATEEKLKLDGLRLELEAAMDSRLRQQELNYQEKLERDWIARSVHETVCLQLEELQRHFDEAKDTIDHLKVSEHEYHEKFLLAELETRSLRKQLDESAMQTSKALVDRTMAFQEKSRLEEHVAALQAHLAEFEADRNSLQESVRELQAQQVAMQMASNMNGSDVSQSGYTSEDVPQMHGRQTKGPLAICNAENLQRLNNSSPDLGIESDAGRVSSVELTNAQRPQLRTLELCHKHLVSEIKEEAPSDENSNPAAAMKHELKSPPMHDCAQVEQENIELRRKLVRTKRAFEDTYEKLRISNQKKAQIEKDIKSQILKTHNVLKNVRANMENEL